MPRAGNPQGEIGVQPVTPRPFSGSRYPPALSRVPVCAVQLSSDAESLTFIRPIESPGHCLVEVVNESEDALSKLIQ